MGESGSGSRRSTLVSRLPIFRRSNSKRQESLPSSPSSGGVGNGVHSSSPSSTNSSSGSTGKRRSLFRTPSLSFTAKRNSEPRVQPINLNLTPPLTQGTDTNGNNQQAITTSLSTGFSDSGGRPRSRHSFGFGSHKKKITRSQTEDFDKASSSSSTANRNVFINCISGSGANEGDDSGFLDDYSGGSNNNKRSSRQKKQLLPKSFSAHHRFSRTSDHHRPPEVNLEPPSSTTITPGAGGLTPGSWPGELLGAGGESSLQSPMISEDRTTAITPSEFIPITEDSVSEVDALPAPSPGSGLGPGGAPVSGLATDAASPDRQPAPENFSVAVSTSQVFFTPAQSSTEKPLLPDTSTTNNTDYETAVSLSEPETAVPCLPLQEQSLQERKEREEERTEAREEVSAEQRKELVEERKTGYHTETTSESEACVVRSEGCHSNPEQSERRARNTLSVQERGSFCGCHEPRSSHFRKPHAASLCSSVSPYHEVMRMERRLRSSSEGAGGPRIHGNHRDTPGMEGCGLLKHRNNSSSSKMGSLDVLNNLGSSELDEDDLMLDLDLSDDQRFRHVSREDSSQSLASCLNLLPSPMDPSGDRIPGKENNPREPSRPTSLLPAADWSSGLGLGREDEPLPPGLETLPLRLMQQDCTAVKTLLLRLRRTLQESTETSPASSLQSLPISPCSEKSLPFKDPNREEALLQQLKEKDELILRLQSELESAKAALKMKDCQMTDRTTQTEHMGPETSHPGRLAGLGSSSSSSSLASRDRRVVRGAGAALGGDLSSQHLPHYYPPLHGRPPASERHTAREDRRCQGVLAQSTVYNPPPNLAPGSTNQSAATSAVSVSPTSPTQLQASNQCTGSVSVAANHSLSSRQPEGVSSSSESLTQGGGGGVSLSGGARRGAGEHHLPSYIPRAVGASSSSSLHSLASRGSPSPSISSSVQASPPPLTPSSASSSSSSSSMFTGRLGQPPRGPLSLHSYSRKNVFLQHSLHTSELIALTQRDS
uniref:serine-rich coiled-coil domain-containing protein 1 n=1 Tax=Scatophagus argus TaxID=75038 RepID=UPI001ED824F7|nr:serine-rich coiled-coil domain-containing protein 1 [Scatophagus argus]XP_046243600.1 serine-rich coiled-coil domain-containing protein 1 [Scatophagus argus]XP_046243601.1 serine-rich coiled-coil domain-containing protein 1 [Scatophagus argus]XP_046243602.1 serine-rich coiled-coil domain-containing protein 1 [Scatophagus argus]XP_046243603.1 serine-rich coiled-coil domain-containing protein 1 [Scatophagus argus]